MPTSVDLSVLVTPSPDCTQTTLNESILENQPRAAVHFPDLHLKSGGRSYKLTECDLVDSSGMETVQREAAWPRPRAPHRSAGAIELLEGLIRYPPNGVVQWGYISTGGLLVAPVR